MTPQILSILLFGLTSSTLTGPSYTGGTGPTYTGGTGGTGYSYTGGTGYYYPPNTYHYGTDDDGPGGEDWIGDASHCKCPAGYEPLTGYIGGYGDGYDDDNGKDDDPDDGGKPNNNKPPPPPPKPQTTSWIWYWTTTSPKPPPPQPQPKLTTAQPYYPPPQPYPSGSTPQTGPRVQQKGVTYQASPQPYYPSQPQPQPVYTTAKPYYPPPPQQTIPYQPYFTTQPKPFIPYGDGDEIDDDDGFNNGDGDSPDGCICVPKATTEKPKPICYDGWEAWNWCIDLLDCPVGYFCDSNGGCCPELPWRQAQQNIESHTLTSEVNYYYDNHKTMFIIVCSVMSIFILTGFIVLCRSIVNQKKDINQRLMSSGNKEYNSVQMMSVDN